MTGKGIGTRRRSSRESSHETATDFTSDQKPTPRTWISVNLASLEAGMGGAFSGRWGSHRRKVRVDECRSFTVAHLVGERVRTDFRVDSGNNWADESFRITLKNRKTEPVEIRVVEHLYRWTNWEVKEKSHPFTKKDAQTIEFRIALKPDEEAVVTYKVHYSW